MQSGERIVIDGRDYQLGSVLSAGAGSYGQVWAATDATGRAVALKFINTEAMSQADPSLRGHWRAHLEREIVFLAGLDADRSRHIVALLDHGQVDGQPVLVMERLGANLQQWLDQQRRESAPPPDLTRILDWAEQILAGLDVVHGAGFVYRDLKFSNLLVDSGGERLKLADFGSLKREDGDSTRSFIGTPATMAPEQVLPVRLGPEGCEYAVDYRADYYALGLLLFALLTGQPATEAQRRLGQLLALHGQEGASQHREQLGGLSDEERELLRRAIEFWTVPVLTAPGRGGAADGLTGLIDRLLARDPAGRPGHSAEIRAVLDTVRAGQPILPASPPEPVVPASEPDWTALTPVAPPNRHSRRAGVASASPRRRRAAGLVSLCGLAGAVAWAVFQPAGPLRQDQAQALSALIAPARPASTPSPPESPIAPESPPATEPVAGAAPAATSEPVPESTAQPESESVADTPPAPAAVPNDAEPVMPPPEPAGPPAIATSTRPVLPGSDRRPPAQARKSTGDKPVKITPAAAAAVANPVKVIPPATESVTAPPPATVAPAAPSTAKPVPKPAAPATAETAAKPALTAGARPAPPQSRTSAAVSPAKRPATAATRPAPAPVGPMAAPTGSMARAERPARPATRRPAAPPDLPPIELESRPQTARPDLPPIKLESRPQTAPSPPPIKLVSRSEPAPVMAPARPAQAPPRSASAPRPNPAPPPPARPTDPIGQFQEDAGRAATQIRRQAEAVGNWFSNAGKEIQRGLDSANQAVNQWTGNCASASGCNQGARVERRDRGSDRHGAASAPRRAAPAPDNDDEGFVEPPPRPPRYYP